MRDEKGAEKVSSRQILCHIIQQVHFDGHIGRNANIGPWMLQSQSKAV
jgi:hypothetical protein